MLRLFRVLLILIVVAVIGASAAFAAVIIQTHRCTRYVDYTQCQFFRTKLYTTMTYEAHTAADGTLIITVREVTP